MNAFKEKKLKEIENKCMDKLESFKQSLYSMSFREVVSKYMKLRLSGRITQEQYEKIIDLKRSMNQGKLQSKQDDLWEEVLRAQGK